MVKLEQSSDNHKEKVEAAEREIGEIQGEIRKGVLNNELGVEILKEYTDAILRDAKLYTN